MKAAMMFQIHYLFNQKTKIILSLYTLSVMVFILFLSRIFYTTEDKILSRDYLSFAYLIDSMNIIVMCLLILIIFVIMRLVLQAPSDLLLIQRMHVVKLIISKLGTLIIVIIPITLIWSLWFYVIGMLVHQSMDPLITYKLLIDIIIFVLYYSVFILFIAFIFKHLLPLLIPIIGVMMSTLIIDLNSLLEEIKLSHYLLNLLFPTIHILKREEITFLHHYRTLLILSCIYLIILLNKIKKDNVTA